MKITEKTIDKLSNLAKLEFNDEEKLKIIDDLGKMIEFVNKLNELDTTGIEPLIYMNQQRDILRDDKVIETISQEEALKNVPVKDSDYIKIPKVLKK